MSQVPQGLQLLLWQCQYSGPSLWPGLGFSYTYSFSNSGVLFIKVTNGKKLNECSAGPQLCAIVVFLFSVMFAQRCPLFVVFLEPVYCRSSCNSTSHWKGVCYNYKVSQQQLAMLTEIELDKLIIECQALYSFGKRTIFAPLLCKKIKFITYLNKMFKTKNLLLPMGRSIKCWLIAVFLTFELSK